MLETFDQIVDDIFERLKQGARQRRSPFHTPVVGTGEGAMRIMVLRDVERDAARLRFHTDVRSPKVEAIRQAPGKVGLLFYDPEAKLQLRARGHAVIETDSDFVDEVWQQSTTFARRCYLAEAAPGVPVEAPMSGLPQWAEGITPTEAQVAPARANFAALMIELQEIDWLYLANSGHRRALFTRVANANEHKGWQGQWRVP